MKFLTGFAFCWVALAMFLGACDSTTSGPNRPPVAVAGPDRTTSQDVPAQLDGSASFDPDGDSLTYRWELVYAPEGSEAGLSSTTGAQVELSPDAAGVFVVRLVVSDGKLDSAPDAVQVRLSGCESDSECADGVSCTDDVCLDGMCQNSPDDQQCDDGFYCNGAELCDPESGCQAASDPACDDSVSCTVDSCDEDLDSCVFTPDDSLCDDELYCNGVEVCDAAQDCQAGDAVVCDDEVPCTIDSCDEDTDDCVATPSDSECDDSVFCNGQETCDALLGCQAGADVVCDDSIGCTDDSCDEQNSTCSFVPDDSLCDDQLFCNGPEVCDPDGGCARLSAPDCDDNVDCTDDTCDDGLGQCVNIANNNLCNDGNDCSVDTCDIQNGCSSAPGNESGACTQGNCNGTCSGGVCVPCACTSDSDCDDNIPCTTDNCNNGACNYVADDSVCDNGEYCDGAETCAVGWGCQAGTAVVCADSVGCTNDRCNETIDQCEFVPTDANCDNGDVCDGAESCDLVNDCQNGAPLNCDDSVPCTVDSCDSDLGGCVNTPNDSLCANADFCDGDETCDAIQGCQSGTDPCLDAYSCTTDTCDEDNNSCSHMPVDADCDDGLMCNGSETCDENSGCLAGTFAADDIPCDEASGGDGNECNSSCQSGACQAGTPPQCDDGLLCSGVETCIQGAGCASPGGVADGMPCDEGTGQDGDECNSSCQSDVCQTVAATCNNNGLLCDGSEICQTGQGCVSISQLADGSACDEGAGEDNDMCNSACIGGVCQAGETVVCDDDLFCNGIENCSATSGCVSFGSQTNGSACDEGAGQNNDVCDSSCQSGVCQASTPANSGQSCDDDIACTSSDACDGSGSCSGTPSDSYCDGQASGTVCYPQCFSVPSGCGYPPGSITVACTDNPVVLDDGDASTCQMDAGVAGQAACLSCTAESGLVVMDSTTFDACDPNGWDLVSGAQCFDNYDDCNTGNQNQNCCTNFSSICRTVGDHSYLQTNKATNCSGNVEEWRLEKVFDFSDLTDIRVCFDIAENNADDDQVISLWAQDLTDAADPAPVDVFCQNNGPRVNVHDTPYRFCVDLANDAAWAAGNSGVKLQFVAHSDNDNRVMMLDNIRVTGWQNRCPVDVETLVLATFDGCPATLPASWEGWDITGTIECDASDFDCYDSSTRATMENGTAAGATMTRYVDASSLEADVTLCFYHGDDQGSQDRSLQVEFDASQGNGWQTVWFQDGNQAPDRTCAHVCINLSMWDPAVERNPNLGLRFTMITENDEVNLDQITLSGADNCTVSGEVVLGSISDEGGGQYSFTAQDPVLEQLDADIQCTWSGFVDGGEVLAFRNHVADFGARRQLTFDNSGQSSNLDDFPVLVVLNSTWFDYGLTKADGSDLLFVDSDLSTVLPYEIEQWNTTGISYIWVKVPRINSGSDTDHIWMYYNDPLADVAQDPAAVWSDYSAVWHLNENTSSGQSLGLHVDATGNGNTGTQNGNAAVAGQIGGAQAFDGWNDIITVPTTGLQITGQDLTIEVYARYVNRGSGGVSFKHVLGGGSGGRLWQIFYNTTYPGWHGRLEAEDGTTDLFPFGGVANTWAYLALQYNGSAVRLYQDAVEISSDSTSGDLVALDSNLWIGDNLGISGDRMFSGDIDELRIREDDLSQDWLTAQHLSMTDALITFGSEEAL